MFVGSLRKRVTIQRRTSSVEPTYGGQLIAWEDLVTTWARVESISGAQLVRSQSIYNMTTHHITVRYNPVFANIKQVGSYRVVYTSSGITRYFDIGASLNEDERNRTVVFYANEGLNDGQ